MYKQIEEKLGTERAVIKAHAKGTQQVTTLLGPTMMGVLALVAGHMQMNTTPANIVGVRSLFWP